MRAGLVGNLHCTARAALLAAAMDPSEPEQPSEQPSVDPPDEEFDPTKPYWVGYFRLPCEDVTCDKPFEPKYELVPNAPRPDRRPPSKLRVGKFTDKQEEGQVEERKERKVLVKSINMLNEREARILSSVSGSDALAKFFNIVRFYGATINERTKQYNLVLERCDMYLQDYVLDTSHTPNPHQWQDKAKSLCKQIANGMRYLHWKAPYNPIIHRDLHPLSVLIIVHPNGDVTAKLFGFQHAKILGEHVTTGLPTVAPETKELWQAPEYVRRPSVTKKSSPSDYMMVDVYSYAMLVWHIFTRRLPYDGKRMVLPEIITKILEPCKRPEIPEDIPDFWRELMRRSWQDDLKKRPDFIKIYKAINNEDATILEPTVKEEHPPEEKRLDWQLDPKNVPEAHNRIISNKTKSYSVVYESEDGQVVLKKPIKENRELPFPLEQEFKQFMEFSAELKRDNHPNILCYDGVFFLESLQMPLMKCSVRQYLEGKLVKRDGEKVKGKCMDGWGSMTPERVMQVAVGVAKGLAYLHTVKNVSHDGLSSSNVLLNYPLQKSSNIKEVKLVDYQLGLLGTSSQSHASRNRMYNEFPKDTDPKRADLYSLGVLMVYMYTGEPKRKADLDKKADWEKKVQYFRNGPDAVGMWEKVVSKCLDVATSLTADEVVRALET